LQCGNQAATRGNDGDFATPLLQGALARQRRQVAAQTAVFVICGQRQLLCLGSGTGQQACYFSLGGL
jgi:hypothetical protein